MSESEKSIVFGGSGFIGTHLTEKLVEAGHQVSVFTRAKAEPTIPGAKYIYGDFMNASEIDAAVEGQDYVFHLVSLTNPAISDKDPFIDVDTNLKMTIHLLESCVRHHAKRVIYTSSGGAIYGDTPGDIHKETDAINPISPYAIAKAAIEGYLRYFHAKHGLDYITLRISNVYGEGQDISKGNHGVVPIFISRILNGDGVKIFGDGSMMRDYIYVKDLADVIERMFNQNHNENLYNIGSGVGVTINEILETIEVELGKEAKVEYVEAPASFVDKVVLDSSRATEEFGRIATTSLSQGIRNILNKDFNIRQGNE